MGWKLGWLIVAPLAAFSASRAHADEPDFMTLDRSIALGRFTLELRPRYNVITESEYPERTEGGTIRVVAGYRTGAWHGWRATIEAIHADRIGPKRFNDDGGRFATSPYPLLPDPSYTGPNQLNVEYASEGGVRLKLGRQLVRFGNQRWVSDNDFRQIPQLFDGATAAYSGIANAELSGGYFDHLRDTSGNVQKLRLMLANASWNFLPGQALTAYGVFHDQPKTVNFTGFADNSYRVAGLRLEGGLRPQCPIDIPYIAEYAQQKPYAGGDQRIEASYWRAGIGLAAADWTVRADHEVKGSNHGQYGVQNPLTDYYAFNGWTLNFFNTPREGLRDSWLTGRYALGPVTLFAEIHRFKSDFGKLDFGRENDVGITWEILPNAIVRLQHARYDPGADNSGNIRKTWLTFSFTL
jgi:hypothetical protein